MKIYYIIYFFYDVGFDRKVTQNKAKNGFEKMKHSIGHQIIVEREREILMFF